MILVFDPPGRAATYEVLAATSGLITVQGVVMDTPLPATFGLIYGQFLRNEVKTPADERRPVKFFDPQSGFVDTSGSAKPQGICQVCHTATGHWSQ